MTVWHDTYYIWYMYYMIWMLVLYKRDVIISALVKQECNVSVRVYNSKEEMKARLDKEILRTKFLKEGENCNILDLGTLILYVCTLRWSNPRRLHAKTRVGNPSLSGCLCWYTHFARKHSEIILSGHWVNERDLKIVFKLLKSIKQVLEATKWHDT